MVTNWCTAMSPLRIARSSTVTCPAQLGGVRDDDAVADVAVVRQVHVGHEEAAGADRRRR